MEEGLEIAPEPPYFGSELELPALTGFLLRIAAVQV